VKRAIAALVLGLAACSSGGDGGASAAVAPTATVESTTTTESATTRKTDFVAHLGEQLNGEGDAFQAAAYELAVSMCELLDSTAISETLTRQALDTASATGLAPDVTATVMRAAADDLCPQHAAVVAEYANQMT
jgi:hypothetical protein